MTDRRKETLDGYIIRVGIPLIMLAFTVMTGLIAYIYQSDKTDNRAEHKAIIERVEKISVNFADFKDIVKINIQHQNDINDNVSKDVFILKKRTGVINFNEYNNKNKYFYPNN